MDTYNSTVYIIFYMQATGRKFFAVILNSCFIYRLDVFRYSVMSFLKCKPVKI